MTRQSPPKQIEIFFCHADEDQELCDKLERHLAWFKLLRGFTIWSKRHIKPGDNPEKEIKEHLNSANLVLLMISVDFIGSESNNEEMKRALKRHDAGEAQVVSVLLRPVGFPKEVFFSTIEILPANRLSLTLWKNEEDGLTNISTSIDGIIQSLQKTAEKRTKYGTLTPNERDRIKKEVHICDQAIRRNPKNAAAYSKKGGALRELGFFKEAVPVLKQAILLDSNDAAAYLDLGLIFYQLRRFEEAIPFLEKAIFLSPNNPIAYLIKALALARLRRFKEAIPILKEALRLDPYLDMGFSEDQPLDKLMHFEAVIPDIEEAIFSRRALVIGLGFVGVPVVGGLAWLLYSRTSLLSFLHSTSTSHSTHPPPSPTSTPVGTLLRIYRKHTKPVNAVAWSPDSQCIASGGDDNLVRVWNVADGGNICIYQRHTHPVWWVTWSPDGKFIASASWDGTVQIWNAANGNHLYTYTGHTGRVRTVAWSPDGTLIASGGFDQTVRIWKASGGSNVNVYIYRKHSDAVGVVAWSPDSRSIASGSDDTTVQLWDATTGEEIKVYREHTNWVGTVAWAPDGKYIGSGSVDKTVRVWGASTGKDVFVYEHGDEVWKVVWSPHGQYIASASSDKTVQVRNTATGSNVFTYRGHTAVVRTLAWSPDGRYIASGDEVNTVRVWQAKEG